MCHTSHFRPSRSDGGGAPCHLTLGIFQSFPPQLHSDSCEVEQRVSALTRDVQHCDGRRDHLRAGRAELREEQRAVKARESELRRQVEAKEKQLAALQVRGGAACGCLVPGRLSADRAILNLFHA